MIPLFLDCDPGIDDAVALGYLVCQPDVEITGVAASGGNVPTRQVVRNALAWLELAGRGDVPVHAGAELPLRAAEQGSTPVYADDTHGSLGTGHAVLPGPTTTPSTVPAAQAWVEAARAHPGELIGVVTGPCTNLALALQVEPQLPELLRRLFIMGGAFNYRGNTKPTTEWNTDFDPESTARVYQGFGAALQLPAIGPIEATEAVVMTPQRLERILTSAADPQWRAWLEQIAEALRFYFEFHESDGHGYLAQIHDPYVVAAAIGWARHPEAGIPWTDQPRFGRGGRQGFADREAGHVPAAGTSTVVVDVELSGTLTRGETVADWLGRWDREPNVELIRRLDADSFLDHLEQTLTAGPVSAYQRRVI
ncbi:nucleoside hydrolase [Nesterenkonia ebinurensis]|uniref:nucleoside hydrolase n=1 Tax=Nesterenkonia ebinurensis TaxID=2608252 RepID=UPI00123D9F7B|nr:nucleoside hydrolase [Nesterenkonia ebinurensis]